ncbi:universal stress protein [Streptomyces sp. NPDC021224]|uniref:universal stress protein n=1 Tax=unclassified Streptomyces TaxID=2593676 RepID=UPI0037A290AD
MNKPLTVGVDGSDASLRALDWAIAEADRRNLPLRVVHAALWERYTRAAPSFGTARPGRWVLAENIVGSARERVARLGPDVRVTADVFLDDPVEALLKAAPESSALVVGNRGRGELADMLLGSVGLRVAGRAPCPVVVVRGAEPNVRGDFGRVSLGVGGKGESSTAVRWAFREAEARGAELNALHAWRRRHTGTGDAPQDAGAESVRSARVLDDAVGVVSGDFPAVTARTGTAEAPARDVLLEAAVSSDLLVVGAHRRDGGPGLQLGAVNHALLHHAPCPVAVVPQDG